MPPRRRVLRALSILCFVCLAAGAARAQNPDEHYQPYIGQPGRDVIWVPTPEVLVEKMLDMARVTPQDFVIDLGSGDGRMVIAAAKRGARALGVEYDPRMVALSRRLAREAGVADKATFVEGDMFEADISEATVLALFLLAENLDVLAPKFLALKPGTRIVLNTFYVSGWKPDETGHLPGDCVTWCTAYLYIVPAHVAGDWRLTAGEGVGDLSLSQIFQMVRGTLVVNGRRLPIEHGRLRGDRIEFTVAGTRYSGRVNGDAIESTEDSGRPWRAVRLRRN